MKVTIKGIIKENREDKKDRYYDKLSKIIRPPYFYDLKSLDIPKHLWDKILSIKFNQKVGVSGGDYIVYNSNGNIIYSENSNGKWVKYGHDLNGNRIYHETSNGYWEKYEYDSSGNLIYQETSSGYWEKYEYDSSGNLIYSEDSSGKITDNRSNLHESVDGNDTYYDKISSIIKLPYYMDLESLSIPEHEWGKILSKVFNQEVKVSGNYVFDPNGNFIYYETSNGYWEKHEYDLNGEQIYYENSDGKIVVNGKIISRGTINESVERKEDTLNRIVDFMVQDTVWDIYMEHEDDWEYVEVDIRFPGGDRDTYKTIDMEKDWDMFHTGYKDREYLEEQFGITEEWITQELYNRYINKLRPIIYEEMKNFEDNY